MIRLEFSKRNGSLYCVPYFFFGEERKYSMAGKEGFRDWMNASKAISDHERSSDHSHAISTFFNRCEPQYKIDADFIRQARIHQDYWREFLHWSVAVIKFLSSCGMAFPGSNQQLSDRFTTETISFYSNYWLYTILFWQSTWRLTAKRTKVTPPTSPPTSAKSSFNFLLKRWKLI